MIVIDSSALVEVLLRSPRAAEIEKRIFASHETLHAPNLLDLEVAQVLRRYCLSGEMTAYDAAVVALAESLPATLVTCDAKLAANRGHSLWNDPLRLRSLDCQDKSAPRRVRG
jgi:predicted nucleic acid-binding protein